MKTFKLIISIFILSVVLTSCSQSGGKSVSLKTEIYCDHCEECESCKPRVENALKKVDGVESAEMKVNEKTIVVNYDPAKTDEQKIKEAIAQTGFDEADVKADATAYDNLDDCCKKK